MDISNIKEKIKYAILLREEWTKEVNDVEIRTRCPFCGDSTHSLDTGHLYINIDTSDNFPIVYHCFRCDVGGVFTDKTADALGILDNNMSEEIKVLNKNADSKTAYDYLDREVGIISFPYTVPVINANNPKIEYIENRLGKKLSSDDIEKMKIVTSIYDVLRHNNIEGITSPKYVIDHLESSYVGFMSHGNGHILFRDITNTMKLRWVKYNLTEASRKSKLLYTISSEIDIMTTSPVTINLTEGVIDILSAYKNLGYNKENTFNMAVGSKAYSSALSYIVKLGLVGSNVTVNIFSDNDAIYNKDNKHPTDIRFFRKTIGNFIHLFKEINIFYNQSYKDIGTSYDNIHLKKYRLEYK